MEWARIVAYITGTVDQELLLRNEYLAAENRILRGQLKGRLRFSDAERAKLGEIGRRLGRKALWRGGECGHRLPCRDRLVEDCQFLISLGRRRSGSCAVQSYISEVGGAASAGPRCRTTETAPKRTTAITMIWSTNLKNCSQPRHPV